MAAEREAQIYFMSKEFHKEVGIVFRYTFSEVKAMLLSQPTANYTMEKVNDFRAVIENVTCIHISAAGSVTAMAQQLNQPTPFLPSFRV